MDARDLFLDQHAAVHSGRRRRQQDVGGGARLRRPEATSRCASARAKDLNSLAWLMWHIARAEDIMVNQVLNGRSQIFEDGWAKRLGITRRDFGIRMTSAEVTELTRQIDVGALAKVPRRGRASHARDRQRLQDAGLGRSRCRRKACRRRPTRAGSACAPRTAEGASRAGRAPPC